MSQPFKLYRLQQTDSQLDQARARLHQIEVTLTENAALHQAQARTQESEQRLQEAHKALRKAEEDVRTQGIKIGQSEANLYGGKIHNPKELQDLQKEIESLKRHNSVLEDRQLECMLILEDTEAAHQQASADLKSVQEQVNSQHAALFQERDGLLKDEARLEQERQATSATIDAEDLKLYNQLRQARRGVAVAKVADNACSACGSTLTPAALQAARSPNTISRCSFCGRILYYAG